VYMSLLHILGIHVEHCIQEEMLRLDGSIVEAAFGQLANKRILFEHSSTQGWVL